MTSSWRAVCLTAGNEDHTPAPAVGDRLRLYLRRRLVLSVEHQPASGGARRSGGAAVPLRPAFGADAPVPARLLAGAAGNRVAADLLAGAGSGAGAPDNIDDRKPADPPAGGADLAISPAARLADASASGRGVNGRRASAIAALAGGGGRGS